MRRKFSFIMGYTNLRKGRPVQTTPRRCPGPCPSTIRGWGRAAGRWAVLHAFWYCLVAGAFLVLPQQAGAAVFMAEVAARATGGALPLHRVGDEYADAFREFLQGAIEAQRDFLRDDEDLRASREFMQGATEAQREWERQYEQERRRQWAEDMREYRQIQEEGWREFNRAQDEVLGRMPRRMTVTPYQEQMRRDMEAVQEGMMRDWDNAYRRR